MNRHAVIALVLAMALAMIVVIMSSPDDRGQDDEVANSMGSRESSESTISIDAGIADEIATETPGAQAVFENPGIRLQAGTEDFDIRNVRTWVELQEIADSVFGRWYLHSYDPGDTGFGFFDGIVSGGFEMTTRFRLNSVTAFTELLEERQLCRFRLEARPIHGEDAEAYGTVIISVTIRDESCYSPQDLVGKHFTHEDLENIHIQVSSYYLLDESGNDGWGTVWTGRDDGYHFDLVILSHEDGYLLGYVEARLELRSYQGEDLRDQQRRGHLAAVFRAAI